jgi:Flp pilus assembly protein TadD
MESRIAALQEMLLENPSDPFLWHALGLEYYAQGNSALALEKFLKAMEVGDEYPPASFQSGKTAWELGNVELAISVLQRGEAKAREKGELKMAGEIAGLLWEIED